MMLINIILLILLYNNIVVLMKGSSTNLYCGLVGFSGKTDYNEDKIKTLLLFNQDRGKDSFGYYVPNKEISKTLGKIEDIGSVKDFKLTESNLFIGHVRAATVGKVEVKNAHPFIHGNVILAMNGTLSNHDELANEYKLDSSTFEVDSDILTACLNKDQTKDVFTKILGGCAVIYTDSNTDTLYCYRNSERPLYRGMLNGNMYISSIDKSLKYIGCDNVKEFKQDNLYQIKDGVVIGCYKVKKRDTPIVKNNNILNSITIYEQGIAFKGICFKDMFEEMEGLWLEPKYEILNEHCGTYLKGYGYECVNVSSKNKYEIYIKDHHDKVYCISKYAFQERIPILQNGSYVFAICDLNYEKTNKFLAQQGDLFILKEVDGELMCKNLSNDLETTYVSDYFRPAYPTEVTEYLSFFRTLEDNNIKNIDSSKDEIVIFKNEIKESVYKDLEELCDFTIEEIDNIVSDMDEQDDYKDSKSIKKIKILLGNYLEKKGVVNA